MPKPNDIAAMKAIRSKAQRIGGSAKMDLTSRVVMPAADPIPSDQSLAAPHGTRVARKSLAGRLPIAADQNRPASRKPIVDGHSKLAPHLVDAIDDTLSGGHEFPVVQEVDAAGSSKRRGQRKGVTLDGAGAAAPPLRVDHEVGVLQKLTVDSDLIGLIREMWRERCDHHQEEKALTQRIRARCRRLCGGSKDDADALYDAMEGNADHPLKGQAIMLNVAFMTCRETIANQRASIEKRVAKEAEKLPAANWVEGEVRGMGMGSLAAIIGEAGDLSQYSTISKLWKRMGLGLVNDERQQKKAGDEALEHGYCPRRRTVMWNIGVSVIRSQSQRIDKETGVVKTAAGPYRVLFDQRRAYETANSEAGLYAAQAQKIVASYRRNGLEPRAENLEGKLTPKHLQNRAQRYVEKRILRDLWAEWRRASVPPLPIE